MGVVCSIGGISQNFPDFKELVRHQLMEDIGGGMGIYNIQPDHRSRKALVTVINSRYDIVLLIIALMAQVVNYEKGETKTESLGRYGKRRRLQRFGKVLTKGVDDQYTVSVMMIFCRLLVGECRIFSSIIVCRCVTVLLVLQLQIIYNRQFCTLKKKGWLCFVQMCSKKLVRGQQMRNDCLVKIHKYALICIN
eukprot:TRINITY_DN4136_c0_g1_i5.p3 TRINITY_DN4136_c0_g1~~TRINITY_DN4136_c0_g1_i5.p3  ORF type:complete len:193 (-),score=9.62 TRINITY_DN4136_c0_g1_i5:23-601(-)